MSPIPSSHVANDTPSPSSEGSPSESQATPPQHGQNTLATYPLPSDNESLTHTLPPHEKDTSDTELYELEEGDQGRADGEKEGEGDGDGEEEEAGPRRSLRQAKKPQRLITE